MKKKFLAICCMIVVQIILSSCFDHQKNADNPVVAVDTENMNKQIGLRAPNNFNSFKTSDPIVVEILSYTNNEVIFPNNYNLRIFRNKNNKWAEIKEIPTTRLPEQDIVISDMSSIEDLAVFPDLGDYSQDCQLRVYVFGKMKTADGVQDVAAYVDISLQP